MPRNSYRTFCADGSCNEEVRICCCCSCFVAKRRNGHVVAVAVCWEDVNSNSARMHGGSAYEMCLHEKCAQGTKAVDRIHAPTSSVCFSLNDVASM